MIWKTCSMILFDCSLILVYNQMLMASIIKREFRLISRTRSLYLSRLPYRQFSTAQADSETSQQTESSQSSPIEPPPVYDFQAPKDESYKNFESTQQFAMRYLILFPIAGICLYEMLFIRKNKISRKREYKLVGRFFESIVVGPIISKRIKKANQTMIYKQDT